MYSPVSIKENRHLENNFNRHSGVHYRIRDMPKNVRILIMVDLRTVPPIESKTNLKFLLEFEGIHIGRQDVLSATVWFN